MIWWMGCILWKGKACGSHEKFEGRQVVEELVDQVALEAFPRRPPTGIPLRRNWRYLKSTCTYPVWELGYLCALCVGLGWGGVWRWVRQYAWILPNGGEGGRGQGEGGEECGEHQREQANRHGITDYSFASVWTRRCQNLLQTVWHLWMFFLTSCYDTGVSLARHFVWIRWLKHLGGMWMQFKRWRCWRWLKNDQTNLI